MTSNSLIEATTRYDLAETELRKANDAAHEYFSRPELKEIRECQEAANEEFVSAKSELTNWLSARSYTR